MTVARLDAEMSGKELQQWKVYYALYDRMKAGKPLLVQDHGEDAD